MHRVTLGQLKSIRRFQGARATADTEGKDQRLMEEMV